MRHFDLCIIGSGSGNSIPGDEFADKQIAIVDQPVGPRDAFGGTCLNIGCIPTKMFVYPADLAAAVSDAQRLGVELSLDGVRWREIRDRIYGRIDPIADSGREYRATGSSNVTLFEGHARFVDERTLQVGDQTLTADQIVIAAGSRPRPLDIPGADQVRVHDNGTIMRLDELPSSMIVLGGGYIAAEFAHVFSAFGVEVTLISRSERLLRSQDELVSERFAEALGERVNLRRSEVPASVEPLPGDRVRLHTVDADGTERSYQADVLLSAIGRIRNGDGLNVEATGLQLGEDGEIPVDAYQRTAVPGIWALGDVSSPYLLKHVANAEARVVAHNLLHPEQMMAMDHAAVPWAVFSSPQIAGVGLCEEEARDRGLDYVSAVHDYGAVAYGWAMEDEKHFCKLIADPGTKQLLGAHIMGPQASLLIQPLIQAMATGLDVPTMARGQFWIHPALTEVVENALLALELD